MVRKKQRTAYGIDILVVTFCSE